MQLPNETLTLIIPGSQNRCFGCGPANDNGLRLEFRRGEDNNVVCLATIPETFQSFPGYLHGGIIATLLDEAMSKAVRTLGVTAMTRQMEVDYLRPVPSAKPIRIEGRLIRSEGRDHWVEAKIVSAKGSILAQSKGQFVQVRSR
jgi:uncharacterized protein (TIGR00369 family)